MPVYSSADLFSLSSTGDSLASTSTRIASGGPEMPIPSRRSSVARTRQGFRPPGDAFPAVKNGRTGCRISDAIQKEYPAPSGSQEDPSIVRQASDLKTGSRGCQSASAGHGSVSHSTSDIVSTTADQRSRRFESPEASEHGRRHVPGRLWRPTAWASLGPSEPPGTSAVIPTRRPGQRSVGGGNR